MFDPSILPLGAVHTQRFSPARLLAASGLAILLSTSALGQVIDLSLNVYYDIPSDINSGGTWKLVGKSTNNGIAGLNVTLTGINPLVVNEAPRGIVNGSDPAGFGIFENLAGSYLITQQPAFPGPGEVESAFYFVGTLQNGTPGAGPAPDFPGGSLTDLQDVPWATGDDLEIDPSPWDIAATFLSGTFADNTQPAFGASLTGRVFTTVGTSTTYGEADLATIGEKIVRTNFAPTTGGPDHNGDGFVDAADYVAWRKLPDAFGGDPAGYDVWRTHFGEAVPGGSRQPSNAVPEPNGLILLISAVFCALTRCEGRSMRRPKMAHLAACGLAPPNSQR